MTQKGNESGVLDMKCKQHYKVNVCMQCRWKPKYRSITKTMCKTEYLLTDNDLSTLGYIEKKLSIESGKYGTKQQGRQAQTEPHKGLQSLHTTHEATMSNRQRTMKLYLECQVQPIAIQKWGSLEQIALEKKKRETDKIQRHIDQLQKNKHTNKKWCSIADIVPLDESQLLPAKSSIPSSAKCKTNSHDFEPKTFDSQLQQWSQTCRACGFVESWEDI
ncbi:hypothetical protein RFI_14806 [Reticulomyxa filosa]|uniref:XPA C-terminal domain-containing protein n=1 Tax=Reticulomyxa filosa TaxID=46433 RepID=X6N806_RETFI|nr:hypothetical protein RFI_14806 [Reticulomyxa filosa]|eukprot:ETO22395.1 hypothetical protein RFI_14806 [Reticulomyxa filosa]